MSDLRTNAIILWVALPLVMYGGYVLLEIVTRGDRMPPFKVAAFRAGHAHAGVLLVVALLYNIFISQTLLSGSAKSIAVTAMGIGVLAQSGGFFLHVAIGKEGERSAGTYLTTVGALLLAGSVFFLVYALIEKW